MGTIVEIEELGRRIRKLRVERRMTLKQVEETSGLSATHLSEIERGRTSPTIGALVRIARALDRDASYFIEQHEMAEIAHVQREHLATTQPARGIAAQALTPGIPGSRVFAYRLELQPGAELAVPAQETGGDALYTVRRGTVETDAGGAAATLGEGDCAHASLAAAHAVKAGRGGAEIIAVLSAPLEVTP
jgi:transcriptional regulator with XRE-family HTH domain